MSQFTFYAKKPSENYHKADIWLMASMLLLWGLGMFTLFVCSQNFALRAFDDSLYFVKRQFINSLVGFVLFFGFMLTDIKVVRKFVSIIVLISLVLCLMTFIKPLSIEKNGARRWLKMPGNFSFQPSELVKFAMVLFLANYFDKQEKIIDPDEKTVFPCVIGLLCFVGIVLAQKDFSSGIFLLGIGILMFFVTGMKLVWIWPFLLIAVPATILMIVLKLCHCCKA